MKAVSNSKIPSPKIMGFDIEVYSSVPTAMPDSNRLDDKVFQISCILSQPDDDVSQYKKYLISLGNPDQNSIGNDVELILCRTEDELLRTFATFITDHNPNIICGYNIFGFDLPYMIDRSNSGNNSCSQELKQISFSRDNTAIVKKISWSSSAYKNQTFKYLDAEGRLFIDLLPIVQRDYKYDNYKLKTVSSDLLGDTKDPLTAQDIFKCYEEGMKDTIDGNKKMGEVGKYCVQDTMLVNRLFTRMQVWVGLYEMANTCNVQMFDLFTRGQQLKVYSQIYKKCYKDGYVIQKNGYVCNENEKYTGATVFPPKPGAYDNVVPFDFSSLYPTTIIAYNIDYSTLVRDDQDIDDDRCNIIEWTDTNEDESIHYRYRFLKEPAGVMPSMLKFLLDTRAKTRKEIKKIKQDIQNKKQKNQLSEEEEYDLNKKCIVLDKRQLAYKISANSMYGSMGVKRGYLPFLPGAMCTTAKGRQSIEKASQIIQTQFNGKLIYGDTDSCYIHFPHKETSSELWDYCLEVEKHLYDNDIFPKPMKLEFEETIYKRFFILTKKRYMALSCGKNGITDKKITKKGVLLARRDTSLFMKQLYEKIIMAIFYHKSRKEVIEMLHQECTKLMEGKISYKHLIITKSIQRNEDYNIKDFNKLSKDPVKLKKRLRDLKLDESYMNDPASDEVKHQYEHKLHELYSIRCLPAQVQLAQRMRDRGMIVEPGSRIEYIILKTDIKNEKLFDKLEDPDHYNQYKPYEIDYLYYLKLAVNPIDQALEVAFNLKDHCKEIYKLYKSKK